MVITALTNIQVAANAYFAALVATNAIRDMEANLSRELMIERIEHSLERAVFYSVFPKLTLGPDQRFASKGCFVSGLLKSSSPGTASISQWIVPSKPIDQTVPQISTY